MDKEELIKEEKYLTGVIAEIDKQRLQTTDFIEKLESQKKELSVQYSEDYYTMDDEEALTEGDRLAEFDTIIKFTKDIKDRLVRQRFSPYFGRIDFKEDGQKNSNSYYIGVNNLVSEEKEIPLVCDWRASVSSLFYDYETGPAKYVAPDGEISGKINKKRQYLIKNSKLLNAFDSNLTIGDDILKQVLSESSSAKMKTIVSTIQKEQNQIIRNTKSKNMLVQGVAGSGKTSIALHRTAFLLYQNKNTLKAEDILILSPNKLFSEYISEVLPELGEENMSQMSFYKLAKDELKFIGLDIEKREDNIDELTKDFKRLNQVAYKNSYEFFESLQEFCKNYFNLAFKPKDLKFNKTIIKAQELEDLYYKTYISKTPAVRVEWIVDYIIDKLDINTALNEISEKIKNMIYPFFESANILNIYADFMASIGMQLSLNNKEQIRYEDLGAILYIANYFFGLTKRKEVKYLIIDEMQDYSFVHYSVFASIFDCNKTILGDVNQCIEKIMTKDELKILCNSLNADYIEMNKAYRSTYQITQFANKIKNLTCESINRKGEEPKIIEDLTLNQVVLNVIKDNPNLKVAILTKNKDEANLVYQQLYNVDNLSLNTEYDTQIDKVCIMPSYMAKGLEFDIVVVPFANEENYKNTLDKNLLYVSCSRALHKLYLVKN